MDGAIPLYAEEKPDSPARQRIRRLSWPFEWLFAALAALAAAFALAVLFFALFPGVAAIWLNAENSWLVFGGDAPPRGATAFNALPLATQAIAGGAYILISGSLIAAFFCLRALFHCYRQGDVFGAAPQAWMSRAALALIVFALAPGGVQPLLRALGSPDRNWFHTHSIAALIVGAALFVFARVVALGREVERESKEFI
jgi:hypothetical protein